MQQQAMVEAEAKSKADREERERIAQERTEVERKEKRARAIARHDAENKEIEDKKSKEAKAAAAEANAVAERNRAAEAAAAKARAEAEEKERQEKQEIRRLGKIEKARLEEEHAKKEREAKEEAKAADEAARMLDEENSRREATEKAEEETKAALKIKEEEQLESARVAAQTINSDELPERPGQERAYAPSSPGPSDQKGASARFPSQGQEVTTPQAERTEDRAPSDEKESKPAEKAELRTLTIEYREDEKGIAIDKSNEEIMAEVMARLTSDSKFEQHLMKDVRLDALKTENETARAGSLAYDSMKRIDATAGELNKTIAQSTQVAEKREEKIVDALMKNFKDPVEMLKRGEIECTVVSAGLRHVKQTKEKTGGKSDYWNLNDDRYGRLSNVAKIFMNEADEWSNNKDDDPEEVPRVVPPTMILEITKAVEEEKAEKRAGRGQPKPTA